MKINGQITILFSEDGLEIEVRDKDACVEFLSVKLTPKQSSQALGRLARTACESCEVYALDVVGLRHENKDHVFEMPENDGREPQEVAKALAVFTCPEGWQPDMYFGSQNSFFRRDGKFYARCTIRRWADKTEA